MKPRAPFTSAYEMPARSPGFRLWTDFLRWQRLLNAELNSFGLTQPRFAILAVCGWLCRDGSTTSQQEIAAATGMDKMLVSQIAKRLEKAQLIERLATGPDGRIKPIAPSAQGWLRLAEVLPVVEAFDRQFFDERARG
jgi:DNA-binding MarR family transcriptional regulator